jgi:hypothetical protein
MIFETDKKKDVVQVGDIKNNNVSIDTSNIDFIVTILSTNLYSKPIESFIRETVSNAWDSHVEAGVEEPVILELGKSSEGVLFCRIQDFGVGLSPERFNTIYKNIGSSTKRSDNSQIGGFGIGRFSALAYSDIVYITSNYEGTKYIYMMYKDGNTISIDLLHEVATDERNGLEVKLNIQSGDLKSFAEAIKTQLVYFENLYIIAPEDVINNGDDYYYNRVDIEYRYNNFKIKKFDNFWVNTLDSKKELNLLLGKVRYPVRVDSLDTQYSQKVKEYPISLLFDIGDLDVTPNREEILYSTKNKATIEAKLEKALEEIKALALAEKTKDYDNMGSYIEALKNTDYLYFIVGDNNPDEDVKIKLTDGNRKITYNGEFYNPDSFLNSLETVMSTLLVHVSYKLKNGKLTYANFYTSVNGLKSSFNKLFYSDVGNLNNISKRYIRETFEHGAMFIKKEKDLKKYYKKVIKEVKRDSERAKERHRLGYDKKSWDYDKRALKLIIAYIIGNFKTVPTFSDAIVPKKWITDTKAADKLKRKTVKRAGFDWSQNVNLHTLRYGQGNKVTSDSKTYFMSKLSQEFKSLVIYDEAKSVGLRKLYKYLNRRVPVTLLEIAPTKKKLLKHIDNFINFDKLMKPEYPLIRNIGTAQYIFEQYPDLDKMAKIHNLDAISPKLRDALNVLNDFVYQYGPKSSTYYNQHVSEENLEYAQEIRQLCEDKNYFNEDMKGLFEEHRREMENALFILNFVEGGNYSCNIPEKRINTIVDYVLCRKLIRPSVKAVVKLKKETINNIIEKDENNTN